MISTFFAAGVIVGLSYLLLSDSTGSQRAPLAKTINRDPASGNLPTWVDSEDDAPGELLIASSDPSETNLPNREPIDELIVKGDAYLVSENFSAAAKHYIRAQQISGRMANELLLRLAFCAEYSRQYRSASEHYNRVLENRPTPNQRWVALSGLSRCWIERGNRIEALIILCDLFLESLNDQSIPTPLKAQINYQLGVAMQDLVLQDYHYDLSRPDGVVFHPVLPWLEELIFLVDPQNSLDISQQQADRFAYLKQSIEVAPDTAGPMNLADEHPSISILQRPNQSIELTTVNCKSPLVPTIELVKQLAAACELELYISAEAEVLFSARSKAMDVNAVPVSLILDSVLLPLNILWFQDERGLSMLSRSEAPALAAAYFPAAADRVFRRFMVRFPGDNRVPSALLTRANLKLIGGDLNQAATSYHELLQRNPREELLAKVFFNLGKVEMRLGRNEQALRQFYRTADQSYNRDLQSAAYWLIAQLCLETQRLPEAIKTAGRSLALARMDDQRRLAALTLARGYLISNQPLSANQVLFENRNAFAGSSLEASASVIGSFARYLGMSDKNNLNSEAQRLLSAIAMAPDNQYEHFLDIYITARAWLELGFRDKAIEKLTLAADSTNISPWRRQFLFELGVQLTLSKHHDRAIPVFEFLVSGENDSWYDKSLLQLAQLYTQTSRPSEAIAISERLLNRRLEEDTRQQVLQFMGKAYRELGQHRAAAVCFAGMLPQKDDSQW